MCKVTVVFANGECETSVVSFESSSGVLRALNEHKPEDFVEVGSIVCKAGDVSRVVIEDVETTKKFFEQLSDEYLEVKENAIPE